MLRTPISRGRIVPQKCPCNNVIFRVSYTNGQNGRQPASGLGKKKTSDNARRSEREDEKTEKEVANNAEPSLYEQLFPGQHEEAKKKRSESEIPRLPIEPVKAFSIPRSKKESEDDIVDRSYSSQKLRRKMIARGEQTSVLVLKHASKNLVEEDFKRLIPQGKHLEGWRLEQGDILRVIPGRDLSTLAHAGYYYLLFSSPLSAFTYQGHAFRIHRMVTAHTPASVLSAIPPPPGYMIEGMDVHAAIESFTLTSPTQPLDLRQLKPPLSPMMESIVRHGGYANLMKRKDRMPFEARLTLEGPQLHISAIKHILLSSGRDRSLGWSGGDDLAPRLTKWEPPLPPREIPSPLLRKPDAYRQIQALEARPDTEISAGADANEAQMVQQKRRTHSAVYIAGFKTEGAMQSFVHFWHRRPMDSHTEQRAGMDDVDLAPVANVEVLW